MEFGRVEKVSVPRVPSFGEAQHDGDAGVGETTESAFVRIAISIPKDGQRDIIPFTQIHCGVVREGSEAATDTEV